ncbi:MAG: hypothetical protein ICV63_14670 [Coleofasciculus sp. Co-bin14]|nr:hypothetical protein [Coleofasciculus sp. Co-bin14]
MEDTYQRSDRNHFQIRPEYLEDIQKLLKTLAAELPTCGGIVHLWSLDISEAEVTTAASVLLDWMSCYKVK